MFCKPNQAPDSSDIAFHAENTFRDDDFRAGARRIVAKRLLEKLQIAVRINDFSRAGESNAVDQAGVVQRVGENNIAGPRNRTENPYIRGVSRTEIKRGLRASEISELEFQFLPLARIPGKQTRAGCASACRGRDGFNHGLLHAGVGRESKIIVRAKVDAAGNFERTKLRSTAKSLKLRRDACADEIVVHVTHVASPSFRAFRAIPGLCPLRDSE